MYLNLKRNEYFTRFKVLDVWGTTVCDPVSLLREPWISNMMAGYIIKDVLSFFKFTFVNSSIMVSICLHDCIGNIFTPKSINKHSPCDINTFFCSIVEPFFPICFFGLPISIECVVVTKLFGGLEQRWRVHWLLFKFQGWGNSNQNVNQSQSHFGVLKFNLLVIVSLSSSS